MRKFRQAMALVLAVLMLMSVAIVSVSAAEEANVTVRGTFPGIDWDNGSAMELVDGVYTYTFTEVPAGNYQFKVVENGAWYGDNGNNIDVAVSEAANVTVTFDPETKEISYSGAEAVTGLTVEKMQLMGFDGWDFATAPEMAETASGVYSVTFEGVEAGTYSYKFAANGSWAANWGAGEDAAAAEGDAFWNSATNFSVAVAETSTVTFTIDLTEFDFASKNGAKYSVVVETPSEDDTEPATGEPATGEPATDETEPVVETTNYYLVGSMNEWTVDTNYLFTPNEAAEGEYMLTTTLVEGAEFKVVGLTGDTKTWFPDGENNNNVVTAEQAGEEVTVYFRPEGSEEWGGFVYVAANTVETEPATDETVPATDETVPATDETEPVVETTNYYLVGSMNEWTVDTNYLFTPNEAAEGEYMLTTTLVEGAEFKVVGLTGDTKTWFPDGENNNNVVTAEQAGEEVTVYFRPEGSEEWGGFVYVATNTVETEPATDETVPATDETVPATDETEPVVHETRTILYTDVNGWSAVYVHSYNDDGLTTEWPGVQMEYVGNNGMGQPQYQGTVLVDATSVIFTSGEEGVQFGAALVAEAKGYYYDAEATELKYWTEADETEPETTEPATGDTEPATDETVPATDETEPVVETTNYYLVGSMNEWTVDTNYLFTPNEAAEGEYMLTTTLVEGAEFKVVGLTGDTKTWFPDGENNNVVTAEQAGEEVTVYFRPEGSEEWGGFVYVAANTVETEPATDETVPATDETVPATDETEPVVETTNYYLVGSMNEWTVDTNYLFTPNEAAEGEYMLTTTLVEGAEFKVVGLTGDTKTWFPDGENNNVVTAEQAGEEVTVYFRPEGSEEWGGFVYVAANTVETEPATDETVPSTDETVPATDETVPATDETEPVVHETRTILYTDVNGWSAVYVHSYNDDGLTTEWPGVQMEYIGNNTMGQPQYQGTVFVDATNVIFTNGEEGVQYGAALVAEAKGYYYDAEATELKYWTEADETEPETTEPATGDTEPATGDTEPATGDTEPATGETYAPVADGFYFISSGNGWFVRDESNMLAANPENEGEYMYSTTLSEGEEFKIVEVIDGQDTNFYNDSNYVVPAEQAGEVTIYFNKTYSADWGGYIYVDVKPVVTEPATGEPETTEPTGETTPTEVTEDTTPTEVTEATTPTEATQPATQAPKSISKCTISGIKNATYTGKIITYKVKIKDGSRTLKLGTDYTEVYNNSLNAGTATYVAYGKGAYKGKLTKTFTIAKAANTITAASKKTISLKEKTVKSKAKTYKATAFAVKKAKGSVVYTKTSKKGITVDKTGKITVKKGTKKGTYKLTVSITAKGSQNYKSKTVKCVLTVKVTK